MKSESEKQGDWQDCPETEQILSGNKVNATLHLATTMAEVEKDFKKIGLEIELQNPDTFYIDS